MPIISPWVFYYNSIYEYLVIVGAAATFLVLQAGLLLVRYSGVIRIWELIEIGLLKCTKLVGGYFGLPFQ